MFKSNLGFIKKKFGTNGLRRVSEKIREKGFDFNMENIKDREWYPMEVRVAFIEAVYDLLDSNDDDMFSLGKYSALHVERLALLVRYTKETSLVASEGPKTWDKHFDVGRLDVIENSKGRTVVRLLDFNISPVHCNYLAGYFVGAAELSGAKDVKIEETKCISRGDPYHEFVLTWG